MILMLTCHAPLVILCITTTSDLPLAGARSPKLVFDRLRHLAKKEQGLWCAEAGEIMYSEPCCSSGRAGS